MARDRLLDVGIKYHDWLALFHKERGEVGTEAALTDAAFECCCENDFVLHNFLFICLVVYIIYVILLM